MLFHYYTDKKFKAKVTDISKIKDDWYIIEITSETGEIYKISETIVTWCRNLSDTLCIGDIVYAEISIEEDYHRCRIDISSSKIKNLCGFSGFSGFSFIELINNQWCDYLCKDRVYSPMELRRKFRDHSYID